MDRGGFTRWQGDSGAQNEYHRRAERAPDSEAGTVTFELWRQPRSQAAGILTAVVATGFGLGFAVQQPVLGSMLGIVIGALIVTIILSRARPEPDMA